MLHPISVLIQALDNFGHTAEDGGINGVKLNKQ